MKEPKKEFSCPLCGKEGDIFDFTMEYCSKNHTHYVCHGCKRRLVQDALDKLHIDHPVLNGEFRFVHRDIHNNITNEEKKKLEVGPTNPEASDYSAIAAGHDTENCRCKELGDYNATFKEHHPLCSITKGNY